MNQLIEGWGDRWPSEVAAVYVWAGDWDAAFQWLDKAEQSGDSQISSLINDPLLAGVREDARWLPYLEKIGMSPEQLAAVNFDVEVR